MKHCKLSGRGIVHRGLYEVVLREESTDEVLFIARTDIHKSGEWRIFDKDGYDMVGQVASNSLFGLEHTIFDMDHIEIAKIGFSTSLFSSAPVDFACKVGGAQPPAAAYPSFNSSSVNPTPNCFLHCASDSSFMDVGDTLPNCYTDSFLRDLSMPVQPGNVADDDRMSDATGKGMSYSNVKSTTYQSADDASCSDQLTLTTRPPKYNTATQSYLHNFGSRVKLSNHNNFILIKQWDGENDRGEDNRYVYMRFGRNHGANWTLDFRENEFSAVVAMGIACSVLSDKFLA